MVCWWLVVGLCGDCEVSQRELEKRELRGCFLRRKRLVSEKLRVVGKKVPSMSQ